MDPASLEPARRRGPGRLLGALAGLAAAGLVAAGAAYGWARWQEGSPSGEAITSAAAPARTLGAAPPEAPAAVPSTGAAADLAPEALALAGAIEPDETASATPAEPAEPDEALPDAPSAIEPAETASAAPPEPDEALPDAPSAIEPAETASAGPSEPDEALPDAPSAIELPEPASTPPTRAPQPPARTAEPERGAAPPRRGAPPASRDPEAEEARLRAILAGDPHDADARVALAALLEGRGDRAGADEVLAELDSAPAASDEARRLRRIDALARLGRTSEAQAELDALSPSARESEAARTGAARLALAQGRPDDAVRELAPLAQAEGASAAVLALYARALLAAGRPAEASQAYAASVAEDRTLPEALLGRAEMAVRSRRPDDALRTLRRLERVLESEPRPPAFRLRVEFLRGRALLMADRRADARRTLAAVVERPGAPSEAWFFLAESRIGADYRGARDAYLRYLELAPDGYYARRARHALGMAQP